MCLGGRVRCCGKAHQKKEEFIPLTAARAEVEVLDFCAKVTIKQRYENKSSNPIEAV